MSDNVYTVKKPTIPDLTRPDKWIREGTKSKLGAIYRHEISSWRILHCGHPTANWPYHLVDPARPICSVMTHNGLGFRTVKDAKAAVEEIYRGVLYATDENCYPGVLRVVVSPGVAGTQEWLRRHGGARRVPREVWKGTLRGLGQPGDALSRFLGGSDDPDFRHGLPLPAGFLGGSDDTN